MSKKTAVLDPEEMLRLDVAATEAGVSVSTIRRRVKEGKLPAVRVGKIIMVQRADLSMLTEKVVLTKEELLEQLAAEIAAKAPKISSEGREKLAKLLRGEKI